MSPAAVQIPIVDHGYLWCSCGDRLPTRTVLPRCMSCGRDVNGLRGEAAYNAKVMAFVESKPIDYGCPSLSETKTQWWARMAAAYEAESA